MKKHYQFTVRKTDGSTAIVDVLAESPFAAEAMTPKAPSGDPEARPAVEKVQAFLGAENVAEIMTFVTIGKVDVE